jgi:thiol:disulfide interchange protein
MGSSSRPATATTQENSFPINNIVLRSVAFFVHHLCSGIAYTTAPAQTDMDSDNMLPMIQTIVSKSRSTLLPVLALTLIASALVPLPQAAAQIIAQPNKNLYSETANPTADIAAALARARREHKRVILDFGGNWCGDCQVLDIYYHQSPNAELLDKNFILVHINIGHMDKNVDVAKKYKVPITKGVPALAVIDAHGNLLYSEREKEFEHTTPEDVTAFLKRWKA